MRGLPAKSRSPSVARAAATISLCCGKTPPKRCTCREGRRAETGMGEGQPELVLELAGARLHHDEPLRPTQGRAQGFDGERPERRGAEEPRLDSLLPQLRHRALDGLRRSVAGHEEQLRVLGAEEVGPLLVAHHLRVLGVQVPVVRPRGRSRSAGSRRSGCRGAAVAEDRPLRDPRLHERRGAASPCPSSGPGCRRTAPPRGCGSGRPGRRPAA